MRELSSSYGRLIRLFELAEVFIVFHDDVINILILVHFIFNCEHRGLLLPLFGTETELYFIQITEELFIIVLFEVVLEEVHH